MHFKNLVILSLVTLSQFFFQDSKAQGTNLLQRYIQQYFKDYYPSTVRSYTLYGNGQSGAADYHAGLPYPYEKSGKVKSVIYSNSANAPLAPPKASMKRTAGLVENNWVYPGPPNNFNVPNPPQNNGFNGQQQQQFAQKSHSSLGDTPPVQILQMPVLIMDPQQGELQSYQPQPMAESRMVEEDSDQGVPMITNPNFNEGEYAEIPVQSAMAF